jgi:hypothetical protein
MSKRRQNLHHIGWHVANDLLRVCCISLKECRVDVAVGLDVGKERVLYIGTRFKIWIVVIMWMRVEGAFPTHYARIGVRSVLVGLWINLYMLSLRHMDEWLHINFPSIKLRIIATITYVLKMVALCTHLLYISQFLRSAHKLYLWDTYDSHTTTIHPSMSKIS